MKEILLKAEISTCAAVAFGSAPFSSILVPLAELDDNSIDSFIDIQKIAALSEINDISEIRQLSDEIYQKTFQQFMNSLPMVEANRFNELLNKGSETWTEEEACWFVRTLYVGSNKLDTDHRIIFALSDVTN